MKRLILMALILCATIMLMSSCSKDDGEKIEQKTGTYDWILDYLRYTQLGKEHLSLLSIDTLHIDTLYSRTKEEIKEMTDAYFKTENHATADGTMRISDVIVAHNYTEMRTIKKDWRYMYHYIDEKTREHNSLYSMRTGSYKNITEVAALDSARAIRKKYGHDLLWFLLTEEATGFPIYEYGSSTATK